MKPIIKEVLSGSPAGRSIIAPGDVLRRINGKAVGDVLDYKYHSYDRRLLLELVSPDGKIKLVRLSKPEGADIGLEFETYLMDGQRSCVNKCVFCFIDQLPRGMRETLYYKDDDVRLSFLQGNYITLSNLSQRDIKRIIDMRISPINVSVHTLDPELRSLMLGNPSGAVGIKTLKTLAKAGITLNCQIVCCPGVNDGPHLTRTIEGFIELGPCINSVSVVPVGLTRHRQGLAPLRPFDRDLALKTVAQMTGYADKCLKARGSRVFFCADELYIKAGLEFPPHEYYEDYPQLENGVGMMRLLITGFFEEFIKFGIRNSEFGTGEGVAEAFTIVTGVAAAEHLTNLLKIVKEKYDSMDVDVVAVKNDFFGHTVTVSGLVTGGDIINQLKGKKLGSRLLIPQNMLRRGEDVFLDDVTLDELTETLGVPVRVVKQDGADLLAAMLGK